MIWTLILRYWRPLLAAVALICIGLTIRGYGELRFHDGYAKAQAEDAAVIAEAQRREGIANAAAHAHYEEQHVQVLIAARQPVSISELCKPTDPVRTERAPPPIASAEISASRVVRSVPETDNWVAYDRPGLLGAIAAMAAEESAVISEFQARAAVSQ